MPAELFSPKGFAPAKSEPEQEQKQTATGKAKLGDDLAPDESGPEELPCPSSLALSSSEDEGLIQMSDEMEKIRIILLAECALGDPETRPPEFESMWPIWVVSLWEKILYGNRVLPKFLDRNCFSLK